MAYQGVVEQKRARRLERKKQLGLQVLAIVGVRYHKGRPYVTPHDMIEKNAALLELMTDVCQCFIIVERQCLKRQSVYKGMSLAKLVLRHAGHPMDRMDGYHLDAHTICSRFSLDPDLVPSNAPILTKVSKVKVSPVSLG